VQPGCLLTVFWSAIKGINTSRLTHIQPLPSLSLFLVARALRKTKVNTPTPISGCDSIFRRLFSGKGAKSQLRMKSIFFAFQTIIHIYYYLRVRVPLCAENKTAAAARPRALFYVFG
jgi:hypothetical protein